ncbi:MAG: NAD(P)H-dependent oxidoreductase [Erysipelotrichaceae bacterium]|nr:NAD(P)H-dependent oxidoreductase [Erysipelotrichaceae bacterium]
MKKILFIVGSQRKNSFNTQLAQKLISMISDRVETAVLNYQDVPFFNEDIEYPNPECVAKVKEQVNNAHGLWIITPEYNGQVPGSLKNLLDWLSRPEEKGNWTKGSIIKNKAVMISSVAGKSAGVHVRTSLSSLLKAMRMNLIDDQGSGVALSNEHFASQILTISEKEKDLFEQQIQKFIQYLSVIPK